MAESAMSGTAWDGEWAALSNLNELLFLKDKLDHKEINDPPLKLTKYEMAEQVLHDIEDLRRNNTDDWLDELPLFHELQSLPAVEEIDSSKTGGCSLKSEPQLHASDSSVVPEVHRKPSPNTDLFSVSYEDSATFILSNDNIICINNESLVDLQPLQPECMETIEYDEEKPPETEAKKSPKNAVVLPEPAWIELDSADVKTELEVVEEIIRNTALELDHWESDTTQSDISSDGTSATDFSSKEKEEEEETDDPDWKPESASSPARKSGKRCKPYMRGGSQEEKKLRKKEQNKNAATRYRQKKKAETHEILREEEQLREKKAKLEETVADIEHEIRCVKAFMRDFFKAKGLLVD